jgi:hypothetical protein
MNRSREGAFVPLLLYMTAGVLIWAAYFLATYGAVGVSCARKFDDARLFGIPLLPLGIGAATVMALAATAAMVMATLRRYGSGRRASDSTGSFVHFTAMVLALLAFVAIVWNGIPALLLHDCG